MSMETRGPRELFKKRCSYSVGNQLFLVFMFFGITFEAVPHQQSAGAALARSKE